MKKVLSIIIAISLLFAFSATVSAKEEYTFETGFAGELPVYLFQDTEFEAGKLHTVYVTSPSGGDYHDFTINGVEWKSVRGLILPENVTGENVEIISVDEDEDYNYNITFIPKEEGEFNLQIKYLSFGYDFERSDYFQIEDEDWVYVLTTENQVAGPSTASSTTDVVSNSNGTSSTSSSVGTTSTENPVINIEDDNGGVSVWVWIVLAVVVVAGAVVAVVANKKKFIK